MDGGLLYLDSNFVKMRNETSTMDSELVTNDGKILTKFHAFILFAYSPHIRNNAKRVGGFISK